MTLKNLLFILPALWAGATVADAANVKVVMNAVSKTMTLQSKSTGERVETGAASGTTYSFETGAGEYILTAYGTNGTTVNGTIELTVSESADTQEFKIITCTVYATNSGWTVANGDYSIEATVTTREGRQVNTTLGESTTANRFTLLAFSGNSYSVEFIPSAAHQAEGYMSLFKMGTLTANVNINGAIPKGGGFTVTLPADAELEIGMKKSHFTDFRIMEPTATTLKDGTKEITYYLADKQVYSYRTWREEGLTQGGHFTYSADESKQPVLSFRESGYEAFPPRKIVHDVAHNQGYETGNIFVNINERGHLSMSPGDTFNAHAMRSWELTDNSTNNYFIEPDFHYTVVDFDGKPSSGVIEITETPGSSWAQINAVGNGSAIVLVTYDAIGLNYYTGATKTPYMGGEFWSAIWPENTAAYVVTVGEGEASVTPNMVINEGYNKETLKVAGKNVDAEHDVFYYLDTEEGATYTFAPEGVAEVTMAYPRIGESMATYKSFGTEGVTKNADGTYTLLLKEGRQIVRLTDAGGRAAYQVLTAKACHREISNVTNPGSRIFQPGDEVKVQYSGLFHPANKLAGIYNMSAYVTYNGIPNGSSLILGPGQYTFGSAPSAQAVTVTIPADYDTEANPTIDMTEGVIQVNGYGDPIGNHRLIDAVAGRSPNFTAVAHKTCFGRIPDVIIPVSAYRTFPIRVVTDVDNAEITITYKGSALTADATTGLYEGSYGNYDIVAKADGYRCLRQRFNVGDDADGQQTFSLKFQPLDGAWDGSTLVEPSAVDGVYQIGSGAELAWFAAEVNNGNPGDAILTADIDLGDFDWTPIGNQTKMFTGKFNGSGHAVSGLFINTPTANYKGLFGYVKGASSETPASVTDVTVEGEVTGQQYTAGLAGYLHQYSSIERCVNHADVTGVKTNTGGLTGYIGHASASVKDCYNTGHIAGTSNCGGVVGAHVANATVENVFSIGVVEGTKVAACVGGTSSKTNVSNIYAMAEYHITTNHTVVTDGQMASGEIAHKLGSAFGQTIGEDVYPLLGAAKVYRIECVTAVEESQLSLYAEELPAVIYTNGKLPAELNGQSVKWYADEAMTQPVESVESDATLYVKVGTAAIEETGIDGDEGNVRWFNLQGIEIGAPQPGVHGIFIKVVNGRSAKIAF